MDDNSNNDQTKRKRLDREREREREREIGWEHTKKERNTKYFILYYTETFEIQPLRLYIK